MGQSEATFKLLRDDLLHPILGGNKIRKLDALIPKLLKEGVTDIVSPISAFFTIDDQLGLANLRYLFWLMKSEVIGWK